MVIDSIIEIVVALCHAAAAMVAAVANLMIFIVEFFVHCFIDKDKQFKRVTFGKRSGGGENQDEVKKAPLWAVLTLLGMGLLAAFAGPIWTSITYRTIIVEAADGHTLPRAQFLIAKGDDNSEKRTDLDGELKIPRWGLTRLTLSDPRYKEHTWSGNEIGDRLVVERTLLGKSLDYLLDGVGKIGSGDDSSETTDSN